jgi:hypothetical protein
VEEAGFRAAGAKKDIVANLESAVKKPGTD